MFLKIPIDPPYLKHPDPILNKFGLEQEDYMTCGVCKVLRIKPDTFRKGTYRGYYPEYQKLGVKRIFPVEQIKELIAITDKPIRKGILSAGTPD